MANHSINQSPPILLYLSHTKSGWPQSTSSIINELYCIVVLQLAVEYENNVLIVKVNTDNEYEFARDMQVISRLSVLDSSLLSAFHELLLLFKYII